MLSVEQLIREKYYYLRQHEVTSADVAEMRVLGLKMGAAEDPKQVELVRLPKGRTYHTGDCGSIRRSKRKDMVSEKFTYLELLEKATHGCVARRALFGRKPDLDLGQAKIIITVAHALKEAQELKEAAPQKLGDLRSALQSSAWQEAVEASGAHELSVRYQHELTLLEEKWGEKGKADLFILESLPYPRKAVKKLNNALGIGRVAEPLWRLWVTEKLAETPEAALKERLRIFWVKTLSYQNITLEDSELCEETMNSLIKVFEKELRKEGQEVEKEPKVLIAADKYSYYGWQGDDMMSKLMRPYKGKQSSTESHVKWAAEVPERVAEWALTRSSHMQWLGEGGNSDEVLETFIELWSPQLREHEFKDAKAALESAKILTGS